MKFVFVNGRVAIIVRYWEQRTDRVVDDGTVDGGARVELRRVAQLTGPGHRAGNGGFSVLPVSDGLWRADLFMILTEPGTPGFHYHPNFENNDVGDRFDDDLIRVDPVKMGRRATGRHRHPPAEAGCGRPRVVSGSRRAPPGDATDHHRRRGVHGTASRRAVGGPRTSAMTRASAAE